MCHLPWQMTGRVSFRTLAGVQETALQPGLATLSAHWQRAERLDAENLDPSEHRGYCRWHLTHSVPAGRKAAHIFLDTMPRHPACWGGRRGCTSLLQLTSMHAVQPGKEGADLDRRQHSAGERRSHGKHADLRQDGAPAVQPPSRSGTHPADSSASSLHTPYTCQMKRLGKGGT